MHGCASKILYSNLSHSSSHDRRYQWNAYIGQRNEIFSNIYCSIWFHFSTSVEFMSRNSKLIYENSGSEFTALKSHYAFMRERNEIIEMRTNVFLSGQVFHRTASNLLLRWNVAQSEYDAEYDMELCRRRYGADKVPSGKCESSIICNLGSARFGIFNGYLLMFRRTSQTSHRIITPRWMLIFFLIGWTQKFTQNWRNKAKNLFWFSTELRIILCEPILQWHRVKDEININWLQHSSDGRTVRWLDGKLGQKSICNEKSPLRLWNENCTQSNVCSTIFIEQILGRGFFHRNSVSNSCVS